jgi:hypothetical protein
MEAWIVNIEQKYYRHDAERCKNDYSAWATEKQAWKAVSEFLIKEEWSGIFSGRHALRKAVKTLLDFDKIEDAAQLVNTYTEAEKTDSAVNSAPSACRITVVKSTFSGSPFE